MQSVQGTAVGFSSSVTLWMRTEYQISGSTPVTSRENGALHDTLMDEALLTVSRFTIDDNSPAKIFSYSL